MLAGEVFFYSVADVFVEHAAALRAGQKPKKMPTAAEKPMAIPTAHEVVRGRNTALTHRLLQALREDEGK